MKNIELIDLSTSDNFTVKSCEVCIVGAGAAGIFLAVELASQGVKTILLEAGSLASVNSSGIGFEVDFEEELYSGATKGRYYGLGGTTARWGGVLVPHTKYDIRDEKGDFFNTWKYITEVVDCKKKSVLKKLGWKRDGDFTRFNNKKVNKCQGLLQSLKIDLMLDLSLPFRKKNFSYLLRGLSKSDFKLKIFINSVAYSWKSSPGGNEEKIQSVRLKSDNGKELLIKADKFIVSAGAIESARILLEIDQSSNRSIVKDTAAIGRYLTDHISFPVAKVDKSSVKKVIKLFSPYFSHGWMRSFRFIEYSSDYRVPRSFFHFIFKNNSIGFVLVKEILTATQGKYLPKVSIMNIIFGTLDVVKLLVSRYVYSELYISKNTEIYLQLDVEQCQNRDNRITLGEDLDKYGRYVAKIKWKISKCDLHNAKLISEKFLKKWSSFKGIKLNVINENQSGVKPFDAYHPVGTCRMGKDKESVVDENLKVYGVKNLWVVSTGVLPSAGTANPTFTMLCLAEKLAEKIVFKRSEIGE